MFSGSSLSANLIAKGPFPALWLAALVCLGGALAPAEVRAQAYGDSEIRSVENEKESQIRGLRNEETTQLRIALGRRSAVHRRADLYLRLTEIYFEAYRAEFILEGRVHEKRLEAGTTDKFIDRTHSKPLLSLAIKSANDVLKLKIPFEKVDQIYYILGYSYGELGSRKESIRYFEQLTQKFPASPYVVEAYREMGDAAFEGIQYRKAQGYYEQAVKKDPDAPNVPRILHKLAWTYYRTRQYDRAVSTMKEAVEKATRSGEKMISLREEALRDMAVFMTESGKVDEAITYFESVAGDKNFYPKILEKLGRQYERNVEPIKAIQVYESLLKTHPQDEGAFRVLVKLVDLDLRRGRYPEALARLKGVKLYKGGDPETLTAATNLRAMVRRTATEHHEKYRKQGNKAFLEVAEEYYTGYLNYFLSNDDPRNETPEIEMYLAEVKRDLGKVNEAADLYRKVVAAHDKRYSKEAGALWTASLADAIHKAQPKGPSKDAIDPSALEKDFVKAADELQEELGETPEAREGALRSAQILAGYPNSKKDALRRIEKLIARWPKTAQALTAARLWIQILTDQLPPPTSAGYEKSEALDDLRTTIKKLRATPALFEIDQETGGKLHAQISEQETHMRIGSIATQERDLDYRAAGKGYEAFAADSPKQEVAEKAYASAVASYLRAGESEALERVSGSWLKRFPGSRGPIDSLRSVATTYLIQGHFDLAASYFERLGLGGHDPESLETAARLQEGRGELARAQKDRASFLELYRNAPERWDIALTLAHSKEIAKQDSDAGQYYKYCMSGPPKFQAECGSRLGDLYFRAKDVAQAKLFYKQVASQKTASDSSPFVAYARYRLAEQMENEAHFDQLKLPEAQLKKSLSQRLDFLEPLSRAYVSAIEAGGPWAVAASARLARWAMGFAEDVDNIQPPQSANSAGIAKFHQSLAAISGPLRKKAVGAWSDAYSKALQQEVLSSATPEIADRLADAKYSNPGRAQGFRGKFRFAGISAEGGSSVLKATRDRLLKNPQDAGAWVDYGNLLRGDSKLLLARLAYDRALALDRKNAAALNNRGVVGLVTEDGAEDDWMAAAEARIYFMEANGTDGFQVSAKVNHALLLNYYRLFSKAKPLWDQVVAKAPDADGYDGQAIALLGSGDATLSDSAFHRAEELGASSSRFSGVYHQAARSSISGAEGAKRCLSRLDDLNVDRLLGFEKQAVENLKRTCTLWKNEK